MEAITMAGVRAEGYRDRDGSGAHGERHGQRIEGASHQVRGRGAFLDGFRWRKVFLSKHRPADRRDQKTSAHLHDGKRYSEEPKHVRADEIGQCQEPKTVQGDPKGKSAAFLRRALGGEGEKHRASTHGIYDGEERGDNEKEDFCGCNDHCPDPPCAADGDASGQEITRCERSEAAGLLQGMSLRARPPEPSLKLMKCGWMEPLQADLLSRSVSQQQLSLSRLPGSIRPRYESTPTWSSPPGEVNTPPCQGFILGALNG